MMYRSKQFGKQQEELILNIYIVGSGMGKLPATHTADHTMIIRQ
jgi:hypothetical protein